MNHNLRLGIEIRVFDALAGGMEERCDVVEVVCRTERPEEAVTDLIADRNYLER